MSKYFPSDEKWYPMHRLCMGFSFLGTNRRIGTMHRVLIQEWFQRPTLEVARDVLGKFLVMQKDNGGSIARMITEVEAYDGCKDKASHAARGKTRRNAPMFEKGGIWYVYFIYGMYEMLNIVTGPKDYPSAVLIRGVQDIAGPGNVTRFFSIDRTFNTLPAIKKTGLYMEDRGIVIKPAHIKRSPRIGVGYAGPVWAQKPYRFFIFSI